MRKSDFAVQPLRVLLVVAFALLVVFQTMSLPGQFTHLAKEDPEHAYLRWPLTIWSIVEILCVEIVIVCIWRLLTLVKRDRIFSEGSLRWVDGILAAIGIGWLMLLGLFVYVGLKADDPGVPMLLSLLLVGGAVLGLLMVVMRALLDQATTLRTDMDEVL